MSKETKQPGANIWKKVALVQAQVERIPKNGYNGHHGYHYATESDVIEGIRKMINDAGLAFFSNITEFRQEGKIAWVLVEFYLVDTETGEQVKSCYWGSGQDPGDKGIYKAYSGAMKYFLMKNFMIPTGDDPENDIRTDKDSEKKGQLNSKPGNNGRKNRNKPNSEQLNRIKELSAELGYSSEELQNIAVSLGIKDGKSMGKQQAGQLIKRLEEELEESIAF